MKRETTNEEFMLGCGFFLVIIIGLLGFKLYTSSIQAEVYRRQGVEMTTWGCFIGIKPVERTINVR